MILAAICTPTECFALDESGWPGARAWQVGNRVGESATWEASSDSLLWIDVRAPAVLRLDRHARVVTRWSLPEVVGALGLARDTSVVLALRRTLCLLDLASGALSTLMTVDDEPPGNRLNDGKVSPSGRWFVFGSMDDRPTDKCPSGSLYRAGTDGTLRRLHDGLTVANGIAWSPDASTLYFSDSHAGHVWQSRWDESTGTMGSPATFFISKEEAGRPDGACVDASGDYWSAGVSAGCLNRVSADGRIRERLPVPCRAPTMPCFGGSRLDRLFITSLMRDTWSDADGRLDGALFEFPAPASGMATPRFGERTTAVVHIDGPASVPS